MRIQILWKIKGYLKVIINQCKVCLKKWGEVFAKVWRDLRFY